MIFRLLLMSVFAGLMSTAAANGFGVRFSGFGTVGLAWTSQKNADFVNTAQPYGPGRSRSLDGGLDSMLGLQADVKMGPGLDGVFQVITGLTPDGRFKPEITLANLRYEWSENVSFRGGRLPPNRALAAEYRRINFTLPWPRPPAEIYGLFSAAPSNGVEVLIRTHQDFGTINWRLGSFISYSEAPFDNGASVAVSRARGTFATAELLRGDWRWTASFARPRSLTLNRSAMEPLLREIQRIDPHVSEDFDNNMTFPYLSFGGVYDGEHWMVMGEWLRRSGKSAWAADRQGAYLTVGRRFGPTMPYVTLARRLTDDGSGHYDGSPAHGLIKASYDVQRQTQSTLALGVNHELGPGVRLKAQVDFIRPDEASRGLYINHGPNYNVSHPSVERVCSVGLDFVF